MGTTFERINAKLRKALEKRGSVYFSYTDVVFKYPWLCLYNTGLELKAKLFNRATIHVIGDSHVKPFVFRSPFLVHHISQATAYNLDKDNSFSQSKRYLRSFLPEVNKERDVLLLVFGEIDARVQIYSQFRKRNGAMGIENIIEATTVKYGKTIRKLKDDGFAVCVHGIPPAARKNFVSNLPLLAAPEQRSEISSVFNKKLGEFCRQSDVAYIDVQSVSADENGFMKKQYVADEVHLNGKIVPFVKEGIIQAFGDSKNF
jgi:hypothetical protein